MNVSKKARRVRYPRRRHGKNNVDRGGYQKSWSILPRYPSRTKRKDGSIIKALHSKRRSLRAHIVRVSGQVHNSVTYIDDGSTAIF